MRARTSSAVSRFSRGRPRASSARYDEQKLCTEVVGESLCVLDDGHDGDCVDKEQRVALAVQQGRLRSLAETQTQALAAPVFSDGDRLMLGATLDEAYAAVDAVHDAIEQWKPWQELANADRSPVLGDAVDQLTASATRIRAGIDAARAAVVGGA